MKTKTKFLIPVLLMSFLLIGSVSAITGEVTYVGSNPQSETEDIPSLTECCFGDMCKWVNYCDVGEGAIEPESYIVETTPTDLYVGDIAEDVVIEPTPESDTTIEVIEEPIIIEGETFDSGESSSGEIVYDNGIKRGMTGTRRDIGLGVLFTPPTTLWTLSKVKIYGVRMAYDGSFYIEIRDKNFEVLEKFSYNLADYFSMGTPCGDWTNEGGWVEVDIPNINMDEDFYITIYSDTGTHIPNCIRDGQTYAYHKLYIGNNAGEDRSYLYNSYTKTKYPHGANMIRAIGFPTDTTPPEALLKFNPETKDIEVIGTDNMDEDVDVSYIGICYERKCTRKYTLMDDAGNKLVLDLEYNKLKKKVEVKILSMTYYSGDSIGISPIISENRFSANFVKWGLKKQTLWIEDQGMERAVYNHKKDETKLTIETFGNFTNIEPPEVTIDGLYQIWLGTDYGKLKACVSPDVYCIFWGLEIVPAL